MKTLADLRKKQYSDRQFVRGRFLAAMQDLQAHDRGVLNSIITGKREENCQKQYRKKNNRRKKLVSDLRKVTKEKNEAQKIIVVEVEGKKNLHLNALNQAKLKRAQAERLLAAFDIAVEEASGRMADKAQSVDMEGRNNSYSK